MACQPKNDDSNFASNTHELSNEYSREKFSTYLSSFFVFFCKGKNVKLFWKCYLYHVDPKKLKCFAARAVLNKNWSIDRVDNVKPLLHVETFSWNLCATALRNMFQQALHRVTWSVSWNFLNFRCETSFTKSRTAFYFCNGRNDRTGDKNESFNV